MGIWFWNTKQPSFFPCIISTPMQSQKSINLDFLERRTTFLLLLRFYQSILDLKFCSEFSMLMLVTQKTPWIAYQKFQEKDIEELHCSIFWCLYMYMILDTCTWNLLMQEVFAVIEFHWHGQGNDQTVG